MKFSIGERIKHKDFGTGTIEDIFPGKPEPKYLIDWDRYPWSKKIKQSNLKPAKE